MIKFCRIIASELQQIQIFINSFSSKSLGKTKTNKICNDKVGRQIFVSQIL